MQTSNSKQQYKKQQQTNINLTDMTTIGVGDICIGIGCDHVWMLPYMIEQFYYVTFWHSKVKTDTFIKYHIQVYDLKYTIKKASV